MIMIEHIKQIVIVGVVFLVLVGSFLFGVSYIYKDKINHSCNICLEFNPILFDCAYLIPNESDAVGVWSTFQIVFLGCDYCRANYKEFNDCVNQPHHKQIIKINYSELIKD